MGDLDAAILAGNHALEFTEEGSNDWAIAKFNVATALWSRYEVLHRENDRHAAISAYEDTFEAGGPDVMPIWVLRSAKALGDALFDEGSWTEAAKLVPASSD